MDITQEMLNLMNQIKIASSPLRDFSSSDLETIYISAYHFYQKGNYAKSCELFLQLISSNPYEGNFWKGLASCYQMQSAWEQALHGWAMLALLCPNDPFAHYHAAECLFAMKNFTETRKAIGKARELCGNDEMQIEKKLNLLEELCIKR
jgi:type III secretion system low calcium response chaperone LcrH/SycD